MYNVILYHLTLLVIFSCLYIHIYINLFIYLFIYVWLRHILTVLCSNWVSADFKLYWLTYLKTDKQFKTKIVYIKYIWVGVVFGSPVSHSKLEVSIIAAKVGIFILNVLKKLLKSWKTKQTSLSASKKVFVNFNLSVF